MISIQIELKGKTCLCIGGGQVAERRLAKLLDEGMIITVISPTVTEKMAVWAKEKRILWLEKEAEKEDVQPAFLVLAMTDSAEVNTWVEEIARGQGAFINRADAASHSSFRFPAITEVGGIKIAVSTGNASPRINKLFRQDLEERYEALAEALPKIAAYRKEVKGILPSSKEREAFWQDYLTRESFEEILQGHWDKVEETINSAISSLRD